MTFDTTKHKPIPPKNLSGRFVNVGETIEANDLQSFVPWSVNNANWKESRLAAGLVLKSSCLACFYRPSVPYECDKQGYYVPLKSSLKVLPSIRLAPKDLSGRFLNEGDIVKENDLINNNFWSDKTAAPQPPKWKKTISKNCSAVLSNLYYRPYQKYLVDADGYFIKASDDKTYILDSAPLEPVKVVKKLSHAAILHNVY